MLVNLRLPLPLPLNILSSCGNNWAEHYSRTLLRAEPSRLGVWPKQQQLAPLLRLLIIAKNKSICTMICFYFAEEFSPTGDDPNKNFRCDIDESEWEFTKPYTSIITEVQDRT